MINAYSLFKPGAVFSQDIIDQVLYAGVPKELTAADKAMDRSTRVEDWASVYKSFEACINIEPRWFLAYFRLGFVFDRLGRIDDATACFQRTLELEPRWAPAYFNLGRYKKAAGLNNEAISLFEKSLALDPDDPGAYISMALAYSGLGDQRAEDNIYLKIIDTWPNVSMAHINFAINKRLEGNKALARKHFDKVLQIEPPGTFLHEKVMAEIKLC